MFEDGSQRAGNDGEGIREEICDEIGGRKAKTLKKFWLFFQPFFLHFLEVVDRHLRLLWRWHIGYGHNNLLVILQCCCGHFGDAIPAMAGMPLGYCGYGVLWSLEWHPEILSSIFWFSDSFILFFLDFNNNKSQITFCNIFIIFPHYIFFLGFN